MVGAPWRGEKRPLTLCSWQKRTAAIACMLNGLMTAAVAASSPDVRRGVEEAGASESGLRTDGGQRDQAEGTVTLQDADQSRWQRAAG